MLQEALQLVVLMLNPIVPHISHALWRALGHADSVADQPWPQADESALVKDSVELVVQVNGKVRGKISVAADADEDSIVETALAKTNVKRFMQGRALRKAIVVPGRLVNLVAG